MANLRPPRGFKRGLSDDACRRMAERVMGTALGQQALRERWARGLWEYIMIWGSEPSKPSTIDEIKRGANELRWDLLELRERPDPDPFTKVHLRVLESAEAFENALRERFLTTEGNDTDG